MAPLFAGEPEQRELGLPQPGVDAGTVHVLWHDERQGRPEIFYRGSTNRGLSWGAELNLSNDPADSYSPFVAMSERWLHLIWQDGRSPGANNHDIFYQRGTLPHVVRRARGRVAPE